MNPDIQNALNKQVHIEIESAYIYLAMAAYLETQNFLDVKEASIIEFKKGYVVKLVGWSYDVETIDYPDNETFHNHQYFNFR